MLGTLKRCGVIVGIVVDRSDDVESDGTITQSNEPFYVYSPRRVSHLLGATVGKKDVVTTIGVGGLTGLIGPEVKSGILITDLIVVLIGGSLLRNSPENMRIHIKVNSQDTMANSGRILEVQDGEDVSECFICDQPAQLHCSEYPDVHYCSEEHKGMHEHVLGDEDEVRAFPFTIKYRSGVGRYMVAARDIQPGELIFSEEPLATGPNHNTKPCCLECMRKVDGSYLCSKCQLPMCEEMCSFAEDHSSNECEIFSLLDPKVSSIINFEEPSPIYWTITVLRLLLKKLKDPPKYAIVQRMEDHLSEHAAEQESWALYKEHV
eukprot:maker-scaffold646_size120253-snap-gene-0.14 protein:Tk08810 transcript:maker-scaffold646_size120253-snap-gene-0.14-mRNA-1 annotation:"protein isoform b"